MRTLAIKRRPGICLQPLLLLVCLGCKMPLNNAPVPASLIYMIADNNLDYYAMWNIRQMEQGVSGGGDGIIFVFIDRPAGNPGHPYLMRIESSAESSDSASRILRVYPEQNSCDPGFLRRVIADVKSCGALYNAELRRLVLWSHGSGWLPEGAPFAEIADEEETVKTKKALFTFGLDNNGAGDETSYKKEMDIKDLSIALRDEYFDLLALDACFMGSIEVAYELRNTCRHLLVSPSEILSRGFPYADIVSCLKSAAVDPLAIAAKFFCYYGDQKNSLQSAAISVIDTRYLPDLAEGMAQVYDDYLSCRDEISVDELLQYDRRGSNYFFDFKDFVVHVAEKTGKDYDKLLSCYKKAVPFYLHTSKMFNVLDLAGTAGLSIYIPNTFITRGGIHGYYRGLEWSQKSGADVLFD